MDPVENQGQQWRIKVESDEVQCPELGTLRVIRKRVDPAAMWHRTISAGLWEALHIPLLHSNKIPSAPETKPASCSASGLCGQVPGLSPAQPLASPSPNKQHLTSSRECCPLALYFSHSHAWYPLFQGRGFSPSFCGKPSVTPLPSHTHTMASC